MAFKPPDYFEWIERDFLATMAWPSDLRRDLEFLREQGIGVVVSLTELPLKPALLEEFGIEYHHMPIPDFTAPSYAQVRQFVGIVKNARQAGKGTVVHCMAGRGRSGTMAAAWLVSRGRTSVEAIAEVRRIRPGSIETIEQEEAIHEYAYRRQRDNT